MNVRTLPPGVFERSPEPRAGHEGRKTGSGHRTLQGDISSRANSRRARWSQGISGAIGRLLVPFPDSSLPGGVEKDQPDPLLGVVDRIQAHMGPAISGPVDELNPFVKPKVSLDDPVKSYEDWIKAVSLLTETTAYKFPPFLPSVVLLR